MPPERSMSSSEDALLAALRAGEPRAYRELYERHGTALFGLARRILGNRADAEDAVQECFLSCYRQIATFRGDGSLGTWLTRIAINTCLKAVRRQAARPETSGRESELRSIADRGGEAASDAAQAVSRALDALPLQQRLVFVLAEVQGLPRTEIAAILGLTAPTVRFHLCKAKQKLRARLGGSLARLGTAASPRGVQQ
jgi:RNA polymerase sigma-70 factor (ECF subfamily)